MKTNHSLEIAEQWGYFLRLLLGRRWTILTFLAVTILMVLVGTSLQTPLYQAGATVLIDMESAKVLAVSTSRDESTVGQTNYQTYADYFRTQLEIIKSRTIAERVFTNLKLHEKPQYKKARDPIAALQGQVKVEPIKQTRLAKIFVEDPDPKQAAKIVNEVALMFVEENLAKTAAMETMTLMKNEYLKLQSKEAELSKRYKDKFPALIRTRQQMAQLSQAIEAEMKHELRYERYQAEGGGLSTDEEMKLPLMERLRRGSMMGGLRPSNVRVQDFAEPPTKPAKPKVMLNLLFGLFLGLLGGLGAAAVEELLDSSLKVPDDVEKDGRFTLLGYVPRMDGALVGSENGSQKRYQFVRFEPHTQIAEAYRLLRTNLIYAAPQTDTHAIVLTSAAGEEGKTTTVTNLGIALAQVGLKVLIVDADLRKPSLHAIFSLKQKPGLSEFLIGQASFEKVIQTTDIPGLWIVTSGGSPPNPAELLGLPQMREFLKLANTKFDRVLLDTPPMIAVTDARVLAGMTKAVLLVAESDKTPRQTLHRLNTICQDVHAKILGVVLNNVAWSYLSSYYGYRSYYHSNYHPHRPSGNHKGNPLQSLFNVLRLEKARDYYLKYIKSGKGGSVSRRVNTPTRDGKIQ